MSLRISKKHGLNPVIPKCFFCGEDKKEVLLLGHLKNDEEAPRKCVFDYEPCDKCKEYMKQGVIFISVRNGTNKDSPYRTGGWALIKEKAAKEIFGDNIGESRVAFLEDDVWNKLKLPRENNVKAS